ncbi:A/G-specific adenine glycosylase [Maricaulis salignorans]|uniref:Adenine DNA glycosylase n=1 Tax=Maricaulis salignorans TaxID=144026 RepID=A0A1G9RJV4_9PROT|nr:A/G-specific adenine glycosylase [Maricaulis salignorans]SDM23546.1 A/G-specific DNA-adenine glycosylase [Maricaulis salignorans]
MAAPTKITALRQALLDWYDREGRTLPWRLRPEDRRAGRVADPYAVWLSEIMLQQTTVPHATPYWFRFLELWPTVGDLAAAPREDVMREWAGLGYYARARNLHACAIEVSQQLNGRFPAELQPLRALPGIGEYTANAILAAAFDKPASVVDGNVERVLTRFYRIETAMPKAKPEIRKLAGELADPDRPGDYAQAIMDLGATICTPRSPDCEACPWAFACQGRARGDMLNYPKKLKKIARPIRHGTAWLVRRQGRVWLRQRADTGLLGGMMEVPSSEWGEAGVAGDPPFEAAWEDRGEIRHVFTHFELRLSVREAEAGPGWEPREGIWAEDNALQDHALPSVMHKVVSRRKPASER